MMGGRTGSPAEVGVFALLAVLAEPDAVRTRLSALQAAAQAAADERAAADEARKSAEATQLAATELENIVRAAVEKVAEHKKQLQDEAARLQGVDIELGLRREEVTWLESEFVKRENSVSAREAALSARAVELEAAEKDVAALKKEYEAKIEKLRAAVGA